MSFAVPKARNAGGSGWKRSDAEIAGIDAAFPAPNHDVPLAIL